jgi:nucleoside 2-deoxyribosyltransferase
MADGFEKRYQVFISSTFRDLEDERSQVIQSLLELEAMPAGMELFPASNDDQWTLIKGVIDECDYYLVVVAGRYGSIDSTDGLSYTEKEYDYAVSKGKPVMGFVHSDPGKLTAEKTEPTDDGKAKLEKFRSKVRQRMCKDYRTPEDLRACVTTSFVKLRKNHPAEGWIRARYATDRDVISKVPAMQARIMDLEQQLEKQRSLPPASAEGLASGSGRLCLIHRQRLTYVRISAPC